MTPEQLSSAVLYTVHRAVEDGELCLDVPAGEPVRQQQVTVESPPRRGRGDYAVNIAFRLARAAGRPPREIAALLRDRLLRQPGIARVEVAGDGFLNVCLTDGARAELVRDLAADDPGSSPDDPAADIARWSAVTGDDPAVLAVRRATDSSLFRVQYAHARTRGLLRNAGELGIATEPGGTGRGGPPNAAGGVGERAARGRPEVRGKPEEAPPARALLALLADHGRFTGAEPAAQGPAAEDARPGTPGPAAHARHLEAVADAFFDFHESCPPLPRCGQKPEAAHRARLALAEATGAVLAGGLSRLGVTAPAHL